MRHLMSIVLVAAFLPIPAMAGTHGSDVSAIGNPVLIAQGQSQGKGKGNDQGPGPGKGNDQNPGQGGPGGDSKFRDDHRNVIIGYYQQEYYGRGSCPPGLAKKNNGCMPPGQANKAYAIGQPWPSGIAYQPLPGPLLTRIGPPPPGYGYGYYGGDVIMLRRSNNIVVDIIATFH